MARRAPIGKYLDALLAKPERALGRRRASCSHASRCWPRIRSSPAISRRSCRTGRSARRNPKAACASTSRPSTTPKGDQPTAIAELVAGVNEHERSQVLLGVTGSGKTFTMAKVIEGTQRPALILAPNKTLAAQLYGEFKSFFPDNAVEYFVSYYDYYQPEAYVPRTDTYIEKESLDQRADRPHAPRGDALAARARRRDHRRLGVVHLRHRLGRDVYGDDVHRAGGRAAVARPAHRRPRRPALPAQRRRLPARHLPRARRHRRAVPGPFGGPRLAHLAVRRRGREHRRVRSADRAEVRRAGAGEDLRQLALRDAEADAAAGDQVDQDRAEAAARRAVRQRQAAGSAAAGAAHHLRHGDDGGDGLAAPASRTIRAISPAASPASRRRRCSNTCPTTRSSSSTRAT